MAAIPKLNLREIGRIVALANSPNYILTNLRREPSVMALTISLTAGELAAWLRERAKCDPASVDDLAERYAYLVALSLHEPKDFLPLLSTLPLDGLEWPEELRTMIRMSAVGSARQTIPVSPAAINQHGNPVSPPSQIQQIIVPGISSC